MPRIGDAFGQSEDLSNIQRGEQRRAERASTGRPGSARDDSTDITSDDVSRIRNRQAQLVQEAKNTPDVRADRVAQARARIREGFFDRPEVRSEIAGRLLKSFGL